MSLLLLSLGIGILIGIFRFIPEKYMKFNAMVQQLSLFLLLFAMGASIGSNKKMLGTFNTIGMKAMSFSIMTIFFSVAIMYIISNKFLNTHPKELKEEELK